MRERLVELPDVEYQGVHREMMSVDRTTVEHISRF